MLIRHAKSSWDHDALADFDRPLNARGRRDAPRIAAHLSARAMQAEQLFVSPACRTRETLSLMRDLVADDDRIVVDPRIYEATPEQLLQVLADADEACSRIGLIGHNPGISELAHRLAPCPLDAMPTCGVVDIRVTLHRWADLATTQGVVEHVITPKMLASSQ